MAVWPWFLPESRSRCRLRARGRSKDPEPCARRDRPRSRTALVQHFRYLFCGASAAAVIAAHPASRSKTVNTFQGGAKDSGGNKSGEQTWAMPATGVRTIPSAEKEPTAVTALFSKIGWRILPFLILCYMIAFLDRINIGYA